MRYGLFVLWMLLWPAMPASAQLSVSIGINVPGYPQLVRVPGYPVYYAPSLNSNYFFYDGMYWVFEGDSWYASSWYNGPWSLVAPVAVPAYVLRVPVRYYRSAPVYFRGWRGDAPPRWGEHWGRDWEQRRTGWDRWDRNAAPRPAPLPAYQRQYSGHRYPRVEQQPMLNGQYYRHQPRDAAVRQQYHQQGGQGGPPQSGRGGRGNPQAQSAPPVQSGPPQVQYGGPVQSGPPPQVQYGGPVQSGPPLKPRIGE